jgi:hypothetical protein
MKKMLKKVAIFLAKIGKILSFVILGIGLLGFVVASGFCVYEIAINTHQGFLAMSDSSRSFHMWSLNITAFIILIGAVMYERAFTFLEKSRPILARA